MPPSFCRTIRFRLTILNTLFLILLMMALVSGINLAILRFKTDSPVTSPQNTADTTLMETHRAETSRLISDYRLYSGIGLAGIILIGAVGGYFLAGFMLKPVGKVSQLTSRISYTNLKERLNYSGPDDEVKRLADTFDDMLSRLDKAVELQKQFIQDASHELRTPIATAITNIEVLEMNDKATVEDYQKLLKILKLSLDRMNNISNSLLLLSQDATSQAEWAPVDVALLISEVISESAAEAAANSVNLEFEGTAGAGSHQVKLEFAGVQEAVTDNGDAASIKRAVINLVNNGIKYNRPGGAVRVTARNEGSAVVISVADTGIGIAQSDLPKLFDRFYRVDKSRSRELGGSGLGLSIVKKIVQDHGGQVTIESTPGQGSTFRITLPRPGT
jgi:signal transduction histidine kinase